MVMVWTETQSSKRVPCKTESGSVALFMFFDCK